MLADQEFKPLPAACIDRVFTSNTHLLQERTDALHHPEKTVAEVSLFTECVIFH